jgi:hypothetical protein
VECRKTCGRGVKRTQILGMGYSTPRLTQWQESSACRFNGRFPGDAERWGCHSLQRSWKEHGMHLQHSWCKTASTEDELVLTLTWAAMLIRASLLMSHCNRLGKMTTTCVAPLTVCAPSPRGVPAHHRNDRLCHVVPQYVKILVHRTRLWLSGMRLQPCPCLTSRSRCARASPWHESRWHATTPCTGGCSVAVSFPQGARWSEC